MYLTTLHGHQVLCKSSRGTRYRPSSSRQHHRQLLLYLHSSSAYSLGHCSECQCQATHWEVQMKLASSVEWAAKSSKHQNRQKYGRSILTKTTTCMHTSTTCWAAPTVTYLRRGDSQDCRNKFAVSWRRVIYRSYRHTTPQINHDYT